ncbi:hypothetical protein_gp107 [Bacillus phage vB_BceM_WH1]|nr:hypothetical protein_gp107 [Bacillus phage vB_BceM_WH1]
MPKRIRVAVSPSYRGHGFTDELTGVTFHQGSDRHLKLYNIHEDMDFKGIDSLVRQNLLLVLPDDVELFNEFVEEDVNPPKPPTPATLSGNVWSDVNRNGRFDSGTDLGLAGVTVSLFKSTGEKVKDVVTDSKGDFKFDAVDAGIYYVTVTKPTGYSNFIAKGADSVTDATGKTANYTLAEAQNQTGVKSGLLKDVAKPTAPKVDALTEGDTVIKGTATNGVKVEAYVGSTKLGEANSTGTYSITTRALVKSEVVDVIAVREYVNSDKTSATVAAKPAEPTE